MNILVTGGAGFIGTNLIKQLIADNHKVVSLDNYAASTVQNHQLGATYITGDVENIDSLITDQYDICFHLAALSRIQPSFINPSETFRANVVGTQAVCEWARKHNTKVIYAGSSSKWHNPRQSPYALYKHLGEEICKMYRTVYSMHIDIARFYNVYGPYEILDGDWAAVIGIWRRQIRDNKPITIVGDGTQRRDFTHVDDIVSGLIKISNHHSYHEDAWELGTGKNYSINEVYELFNARYNVDKVHLPQQLGNYKETLRENNDALEKLGWSPKKNLTEYINNL